MEVPPAADDDLAESIRAYFQGDRSRMTMMAARKFAVPEQAVVEALVGQWPIVRLRDGAFRELMDALPGLGTMRVFVRSKAAVIESVGPSAAIPRPARSSTSRPTPSTCTSSPPRSMRSTPSRSGGTTPLATHSFQFFDRAGDAAFKAFLWEDFPNVPRPGSRRSTPWPDASRTLILAASGRARPAPTGT